MQFKLNQIVLIATAASFVAASPIPEPIDNSNTPLSCNADSHPCQTYTAHSQCSSEWTKDLQKCIKSRCMSFFQDPLDACKSKKPVQNSIKDTVESSPLSFGCALRANACKTQIKAEMCTAEWKTQVLNCMGESCVKGIFDNCKPTTENSETLVKKDDTQPESGPLPGSRACQFHAQGCRIQIQAKRCTAEWKLQVTNCMPASCVSADMNECALENQPTVNDDGDSDSSTTKISAHVCAIHASACRYQVVAPACSVEWKKQVTGCMPADCVADQINSCDQNNSTDDQ